MWVHAWELDARAILRAHLLWFKMSKTFDFFIEGTVFEVRYEFLTSNALPVGSFFAKHGVTLKTYHICLLGRRFEFGTILF